MPIGHRYYVIKIQCPKLVNNYVGIIYNKCVSELKLEQHEYLSNSYRPTLNVAD